MVKRAAVFLSLVILSVFIYWTRFAGRSEVSPSAHIQEISQPRPSYSPAPSFAGSRLAGGPPPAVLVNQRSAEPDQSNQDQLPSTLPSFNQQNLAAKSSQTSDQRTLELENLAWRGPKDVLAPEYDLELQQASKITDPNRAQVTTQPFLAGRYDMLVDTLPDRRRYVVKVALAHLNGEEDFGFIPVELVFSSGGGKPQNLDYRKFVSRFHDQEVFGASMAFPYDAFWRAIGPDLHCLEVLFVRVGWGVPSQGKYAHSFDGRVYCRTGLQELRPMAQVAFCHEAKDC